MDLSKLSFGLVGVGCALVMGMGASPARADITQYTNRADFEDALGAFLVEGYDAKGYAHGDVIDDTISDIHTNVQMSGILGETDYVTTGFNNWNIIFNQPLDPRYCAGCNGSYPSGRVLREHRAAEDRLFRPADAGISAARACKS